MKNPLEFLTKKPQADDTYLGLFLKEGEGILFYINQTKPGNLKVSQREKFSYSQDWERLTEDVDQVLNRLETATGKSPEKTVFFIYSNLVDPVTRQIKRNYLTKIKQLVKNLELKPLGFIECHEAISDYLQHKEKMPLTANLIEFDKTSLGVFVYTTGRLIFAESVTRGPNLMEDLVPIFDKIKTQTVLPPRIILYDSQSLDVEASNLLTYQWGKDFFIQLPRVQIFKEEQVIESFLTIFSSQMAEGVTPVVSNDGPPPPEAKNEEVMGFVIGDDVKAKPQQTSPQTAAPLQKPRLRQTSPLSSMIPSAAAGRFFAQVGQTAGKLFKQAKALPFPVLPAIGAILILGALFIMEYYFHSAKVRVFLPAQKLTKDLEVEAVLGGTSDKDTLALQMATEEADLNQSQPATGTQSVGEKAKGAVTVLNYDSNSTSFEAGTIIQAQGLSFALENNVTVASASVAQDLSLQPGKSNVSVVAEEIGPESNLAKDQKFQIGDSPQNKYLATNPNAFAGGTKSQIQTVSEEDVAAIEDKLLDKAKSYTSGTLKNKIPKNYVLIPQLITYDLGEISYSQGVGDEATSVEGKSSSQITYLSYKQEDFLAIANSNLQPEVRPGFKINNDVTKYKINEVEGEEGDYTLSIAVDARAVADIKTDDLVAKARGKTSNGLQTLVKEEYRAEGMDLETHHPLPWFKNWLPLFKKNIDLEISYL